MWRTRTLSPRYNYTGKVSAGSFTSRDSDFSLPHQLQTGSGTSPTSSVVCISYTLHPGLELMDREPDHSPPSSAKNSAVLYTRLYVVRNP